MSPLLSWALLGLLVRSSAGVGVIFSLQEEDTFILGETVNISISLRYDGIDMKDYGVENLPDVNLTFSSMDGETPLVVDILTPSLVFQGKEVLKEKCKNLTMFTSSIGVSSIKVFAEINDGSGEVPGTVGTLDLVVIQGQRTLNVIFTYILTAMIMMNSINMGSTLDVGVVKAVLKTPIAPAVGFCSQFIVMPLVSFAIGALAFDNPLYRIGLFMFGCCPGGVNSNFWCILLGGDVSLSVTMTVVSTVAALGMMPLWLFVLGSRIVDDALVIPYLRLFLSLLM